MIMKVHGLLMVIYQNVNAYDVLDTVVLRTRVRTLS